VWGETREEEKALALAVTLFSPPRVIMTREREFGEKKRTSKKKNGRRSTAKKKKMIGAVVAPTI